MAVNFEQIVRPFQSPTVINDKKVRITRVTKVSTDKAILTWGSAGDSPETEQVGAKIIVKGTDVKKAYTQKSTKTTDIRVENPQDKNQFVVERRIDQIVFTRPKPFSDNKTGQPSNIAPGLQSPVVTANSGTTTTASSGTTITKTEGGLTTQYVNGNTNVTETSTAGTTVTAATKRTETDTFILDWSNIA